jgi:hypothetical protein
MGPEGGLSLPVTLLHRARGHSLEKSFLGAPQQPRQRFDERLMIDQRIGETIGLAVWHAWGERQVLLRQDARRAGHHFHVLEPLGKPQQELDACSKR